MLIKPYPPSKPKKPVEPKRKIVRLNYTIQTINCVGDKIHLFTKDGEEVEVICTSSGYDNFDVEVRRLTPLEEEVDNPYYDSELRQYEYNLKNYPKELKLYESKYEEYKAKLEIWKVKSAKEEMEKAEKIKKWELNKLKQLQKKYPGVVA